LKSALESRHSEEAAAITLRAFKPVCNAQA
jgi:hypothetical protein